MGGEPAGGGARLVRRKYIVGVLFLLFRMLSLSIEKQRKRPPLFKDCLAKEMRAIFEIMFGGRICGCCILTISVEKKRKRPPFVFFRLFWKVPQTREKVVRHVKYMVI